MQIAKLGQHTRIMGALNITPDSFSDGGKYMDPSDAVKRALRMVEEGADIVDVGGESSRPGAESIAASEELRRVMPVVKALREISDIPISIDTCKSEVARQALSEGASMINDITALRGDRDMAGTIASFDASVVLMHMKGDPRTMQGAPHYDDIMSEISDHLAGSIEIAAGAGIDPDKIIVDPGIGFGKTVEHNIEILKKLEQLKGLGKPILVGTSRKSFIGELTGKGTDGRMFGTAATVTAAILKGADIIRVHDIGEMRDVVFVTDALKRTD
jgi:dihydropteroate synthase